MRFAVAAAAVGLATVAAAQNVTVSASDVYVTDVVTAYTTYCPEATKVTVGGQTYTVSEATTLTITSCSGGCTVTSKVSSSTPAVVAPVSSTLALTTSAVVVPGAPSASSSIVVPVSGAPYPSTNGTAVGPYASGTAAASGTGSAASGTSTGAPMTGAASKTVFSAGAGFLALFGLVAAL